MRESFAERDTVDPTNTRTCHTHSTKPRPPERRLWSSGPLRCSQTARRVALKAAGGRVRHSQMRHARRFQPRRPDAALPAEAHHTPSRGRATHGLRRRMLGPDAGRHTAPAHPVATSGERAQSLAHAGCVGHGDERWEV
ncbi:hypothetical protein B0H10DRAFT_2219236 [Mycena sp. CBHHK59/15]|nr:hypothetical protein B0H10DRAFT_2219236 [Mycena sp. CBHHK59/15]